MINKRSILEEIVRRIFLRKKEKIVPSIIIDLACLTPEPQLPPLRRYSVQITAQRIRDFFLPQARTTIQRAVHPFEKSMRKHEAPASDEIIRKGHERGERFLRDRFLLLGGEKRATELEEERGGVGAAREEDRSGSKISP